jgi:hypothetical protein
MPTQLYTHGLPFTRLLRRLLADGLPLEDVPARVNAMRASGEIQMIETPRQRKLREFLPAQWWLVELPDGRLQIDTDWQPVDPIQLLYRERLPATREEEIASRLEQLLAEDPDALKGDAEIAAAKWLALKLKLDDSVLRGDHEAECRERFKLEGDRSYDRVWKAARYSIGLPMQRKGGAPSKN